MAQRIEDILAAHGRDFRVTGPELLIKCPLCGDADPSEHLSISLQRRGWRCLRNPRGHRGRSYVRILKLILRCSEERATELLGVRNARPLPDKDEFAETWRRQLGLTEVAPTRPLTLSLPREARPLYPGVLRSDGFWRYLTGSEPGERGFTRKQAEWAADAYNLHFALGGQYAYRILIPIYGLDRKLKTWTARHISANAEIRYLSLKKDEHVTPPGELLLGLDFLPTVRKARCLVVCEGPFDAIAVSAIGHKFGVWGTCVFGLEVSEPQANLLADISSGFDRVRLLLDPDAWHRVLSLRGALHRSVLPIRVPRGFKDPGELVKTTEGIDFVRSLAA